MTTRSVNFTTDYGYPLLQVITQDAGTGVLGQKIDHFYPMIEDDGTPTMIPGTPMTQRDAQTGSVVNLFVPKSDGAVTTIPYLLKVNLPGNQQTLDALPDPASPAHEAKKWTP
jgi:hypothetical protein